MKHRPPAAPDTRSPVGRFVRLRQAVPPSFGWWRLTGLAGIVYAVGWTGLSLLPARDVFRTRFPITNPEGFLAAREGSALWVVYFEGLLAGVFLLIFCSGLRSYLARAEGGYSMWSHIVLVAGAVTAGLTLAVHPLMKAMALTGTSRMDEFALQGAVRLESAFQSTLVLPLGTLVLAASVVVLRTGVFGKWLGAIGLVASVALFVGAAWPVAGPSLGVLGFSMLYGRLLLIIWFVAVGVSLLRVKSPPLHMPGEGLFQPEAMRRRYGDL